MTKSSGFNGAIRRFYPNYKDIRVEFVLGGFWGHFGGFGRFWKKNVLRESPLKHEDFFG